MLIIIGSMVGSFSVQHVNTASSTGNSIDIPSCNTDLHEKCIKRKSKVFNLYILFIYYFLSYFFFFFNRDIIVI